MEVAGSPHSSHFLRTDSSCSASKDVRSYSLNPPSDPTPKTLEAAMLLWASRSDRAFDLRRTVGRRSPSRPSSRSGAGSPGAAAHGCSDEREPNPRTSGRSGLRCLPCQYCNPRSAPGRLAELAAFVRPPPQLFTWRWQRKPRGVCRPRKWFGSPLPRGSRGFGPDHPGPGRSGRVDAQRQQLRNGFPRVPRGCRVDRHPPRIVRGVALGPVGE